MTKECRIPNDSAVTRIWLGQFVFRASCLFRHPSFVIRHSPSVIQLSSMHDQALEDLFAFLRFPSVSTDDAYKKDVNACAQWLVTKLKGIGLTTELVPTAGHPVVWARNEHK